MPPLNSSVSLSDILTAAKNIASALNNGAQTYLNIQGAQNLAAISTTTLVRAGGGRIAQISVTTAGSTTGLVYDTNLASSTSNPIYVIPEAVGLYLVNLPVNFGIVVAPGTSQVLTISYSTN